MDVTKCDVCGKIFNEQSRNNAPDEGSGWFSILKKVDPNEDAEWKGMDLCPTCAAATNEFIEKRSVGL